MAPRPASTLLKEGFRRRNHTLRKKAHELARLSGAHVYCVVLFHGQYHTYTSHRSEMWPPPPNQIVSAMLSTQKLLLFDRLLTTRRTIATRRRRRSSVPIMSNFNYDLDEYERNVHPYGPSHY
jgi:hypothetical protein